MSGNNKEIEVKILEIDQEKIIDKLRSLGAKKIFEGEVEATFLKNDHLDKNHTLRVRKVGEKVELCFKGKSEESKFKIKEELEVITDNYLQTIKIFDRLGFKESFHIKKRRESYHLGKVKFEIDTYPGIPTFLEIEAPSEEEVEEAVKKLGYTLEDTKNYSAKQLFKHYGKDKTA